MEGYKIVTATEMRRIEELSIQEGASAERYMEQGAQGIAEKIKEFTSRKKREKRALFLIGKGNKGGDGLAAARFLLKEGFALAVYHLFSKEASTPLCQKMQEKFESSGGEVIHLKQAGEISPFLGGVIIDALLGTGFRGELRGLVAQVTTFVNRLPIPILSIDIPSGVEGDSGEVKTVAIEAQETFFLQMPKRGFFVGEGYNHIGKLQPVHFGLSPEYVRSATGVGYVVKEEDLKELLPPLVRNRHKYQAGYLLALAGSPGMGGAALLSSLSALRTGAGIVRLFYPEEMQKELLFRPWELITSSYQDRNLSYFLEENRRANALLCGPGMGREERAREIISRVLFDTSLPLLLDADALFHVGKVRPFPKRTLVLTPHHGEMSTLLGQEKMKKEEVVVNGQLFAKQEDLTLVLKGAPTWIFHKNSPPLVIPKGDPGMATAGSGDVLSGIIAALLAQRVEARKAAVLGATLHALAGEIVAKEKSSYGMIASDIIEAIPKAFLQLLAT